MKTYKLGIKNTANRKAASKLEQIRPKVRKKPCMAMYAM